MKDKITHAIALISGFIIGSILWSIIYFTM